MTMQKAVVENAVVGGQTSVSGGLWSAEFATPDAGFLH
jgi:hypothetical protein